jgi:hypothetical protein
VPAPFSLLLTERVRERLFESAMHDPLERDIRAIADQRSAHVPPEALPDLSRDAPGQVDLEPALEPRPDSRDVSELERTPVPRRFEDQGEGIAVDARLEQPVVGPHAILAVGLEEDS